MGIKEMRNKFSSMGQQINSHSTLIKQLESQMRQIFASLNAGTKSTLMSETIVNSNDNRNNAHRMIVTTQIGKVLEKEVVKKNTSLHMKNEETKIVGMENDVENKLLLMIVEDV